MEGSVSKMLATKANGETVDVSDELVVAEALRRFLKRRRGASSLAAALDEHCSVLREEEGVPEEAFAHPAFPFEVALGPTLAAALYNISDAAHAHGVEGTPWEAFDSFEGAVKYAMNEGVGKEAFEALDDAHEPNL